MTKSLPLPATIDLPATMSLADTLRASNGAILLDGSAVERIGIPGIQLLLSARATMDTTGGTFVIERASDALCASLATAGAERLLADR